MANTIATLLRTLARRLREWATEQPTGTNYAEELHPTRQRT